MCVPAPARARVVPRARAPPRRRAAGRARDSFIQHGSGARIGRSADSRRGRLAPSPTPPRRAGGSLSTA
eukprot:30827-Pelagococcus_subviridis.AAC.12